MLCPDYDRIEKAILYLDRHFLDQPRLDQLARAVGLSEFHFQRLFRRWAGISPKRFIQVLTAGYARELLRQSRPVLETALDAGLSGPGRLHDLIVNVDAVTPGQVRRAGDGLAIAVGIHPSPFGQCLIGLTERGICALEFLEPKAEAQALAGLRSRWPRAILDEQPRSTQATVNQIFANARRPLALLLHGTNTQIKVWEALLRIPPGCLATYQDVASQIGLPRSSRAVARIIGQNPVAFLVPCHRVIRQTGAFGGYRWGEVRKRAILGWELGRVRSNGEVA